MAGALGLVHTMGLGTAWVAAKTVCFIVGNNFKKILNRVLRAAALLRRRRRRRRRRRPQVALLSGCSAARTTKRVLRYFSTDFQQYYKKKHRRGVSSRLQDSKPLMSFKFNSILSPHFRTEKALSYPFCAPFCPSILVCRFANASERRRERPQRHRKRQILRQKI